MKSNFFECLEELFGEMPFLITCTILAAIIAIPFYLMCLFLAPLLILLIGVTMIAVVMFVSLKFDNRLNCGTSFILAVVFVLGIASMWSGYLKGVSEDLLSKITF